MAGGYLGCEFLVAGAVGVTLEVRLLDALDGVLPRARYRANGGLARQLPRIGYLQLLYSDGIEHPLFAGIQPWAGSLARIGYSG